MSKATATIVMALMALAAGGEQGERLSWTAQESGVTARLRGVSAVSPDVAWASGAHGTILRTADAGRTWRRLTIAGTDALDFRDVDAIDPAVALALSIGPGDSSRIYRTTDAGTSWHQAFINRDPKAFFDAMSFADPDHGVAVSDSVEGRFVIIITHDGGRTWAAVPASVLPPALPNEGAFAASGSNIATMGEDVWIGTGAAAAARVLHSPDRGRTWTVAATPVGAQASAGIFSIAFRDGRHGVVVGGDYRRETDAVDNVAVTNDGGATWTLGRGLSGFRSAVAYVPGSESTLVAIGPSGADVSTDDGRTWTPVENAPGADALSFVKGRAIAWSTGDKGRINRLTRGALPRAPQGFFRPSAR